MGKNCRLCLNIVLLPLLLFVLLILCCRDVFAMSPPLLRVGISLTGNHLLLDYENGDTMTSLENGAQIKLSPGRYRLENSGGSIHITSSSGTSYGVFSGPLRFVPAQGSFVLGNACNGTAYRGSLEIVEQGTTALTAVNLVDLESYLRSVVPRESIPTWGNYNGMEALKAQSVAARTHAIYNMSFENHQDEPFQICDTQHCQLYGGSDSETPNTDRAVVETRGNILTWNGNLINAIYHSNNGGFTECSGNVWNTSLPYLHSVPDPFDDPFNRENVSHPQAIWEKDVPVGILNSFLTGDSISNIIVNDVKVASHFPSGRVNELCISGGGQTISFFKEQVRTVLGLRSQLYSVREQPEKRVWVASAGNGITETVSYSELEGKWSVCASGSNRMLTGESFCVIAVAGRRDTVPYLAYIFDGKGIGHGIGLSQYGAYNRSRSGHAYDDILSFYYPGTELRTAY